MLAFLRKLVITMLTVHFLVFAAAFGYAAVSVGAQELLPPFQGDWIAAQAFIWFVDLTLAAHLFAILLSFSLTRSGAGSESGGGSGVEGLRVSQLSLVVFLIFGVLYAINLLAFEPAAVRARRTAVLSSQEARSMRTQALRAAEEGRAALAEEYARGFLDLVPEDPEMEALARGGGSIAQSDSSISGRSDSPGEDRPARVRGTSENAVELFQRAQAFFDSGDYFSAQYYATLASEIRPDRRDFQELRSRAENRIADLGETIEEGSQRRVFDRKQEGQRALLNDDPVAAYRIFAELAADRPRDPDVTEFFAAAEAALQDIAFFAQEFDAVEPLLGEKHLTFTNSDTAETVELVHLGAFIDSPRGVFAEGLEVVRFLPNGDVLLHARAPEAKLRGTNNGDGLVFVLRAIDREDGSEVSRPEFLTGRPESALEFVLPVNLSLETLRYVGRTSYGLGGLDVRSLFYLAGNDSWPQQSAVRTELVSRLAEALSFISLGCFAAGLGWAAGTRYIGRPPIPVFALLPVAAGVLYALSSVYLYVMRLVSGFLVVQSGLTVVLLAQALLQFGILVAGLIVMASNLASNPE